MLEKLPKRQKHLINLTQLLHCNQKIETVDDAHALQGTFPELCDEALQLWSLCCKADFDAYLNSRSRSIIRKPECMHAGKRKCKFEVNIVHIMASFVFWRHEKPERLHPIKNFFKNNVVWWHLEI